MKCHDFDLLIDEMLSGVLHPDAAQHMRQCERCSSHYSARRGVQRGLQQLAAASPAGPSAQTDHAVMESFRRLQQRRRGGAGAEVISFPLRQQPPVWHSRSPWSGAAAAAVLLAVLGSAVHIWRQPTVQAPTTQSAKTSEASMVPQAAGRAMDQVVHAAARRVERTVTHAASVARAARTELASAQAPLAVEQERVLRATPVYGGAESFSAGPQTTAAPPVMRLASTGGNSQVAQTASSTWPGYSNLMYCDPVVCSGPMQVVRIKVPVEQVSPSVGQSRGNAFVNADVVVGPDGMARAIRLAN
jgi:hypothetical protein